MAGQTRGDDERAVRPGKRLTDRLDGTPIQLAGAGEVGEVVVERQVDHPVCELSARSQAIEILEVAGLGPRTCRLDGPRRGI